LQSVYAGSHIIIRWNNIMLSKHEYRIASDLEKHACPAADMTYAWVLCLCLTNSSSSP
jgi:hypothetical protein